MKPAVCVHEEGKEEPGKVERFCRTGSGGQRALAGVECAGVRWRASSRALLQVITGPGWPRATKTTASLVALQRLGSCPRVVPGLHQTEIRDITSTEEPFPRWNHVVRNTTSYFLPVRGQTASLDEVV